MAENKWVTRVKNHTYRGYNPVWNWFLGLACRLWIRVGKIHHSPPKKTPFLARQYYLTGGVFPARSPTIVDVWSRTSCCSRFSLICSKRLSQRKPVTFKVTSVHFLWIFHSEKFASFHKVGPEIGEKNGVTTPWKNPGPPLPIYKNTKQGFVHCVFYKTSDRQVAINLQSGWISGTHSDARWGPESSQFQCGYFNNHYIHGLMDAITVDKMQPTYRGYLNVHPT